MKLLEYEAKRLFTAAGIPTPRGSLFRAGDATDSLPIPCVVKSQVPTGGRGKAGGVKVVTEQPDLAPTLNDILHKSIKGFTPKTLLIEELVNIHKEFYLSLLINRATATIEVLAHRDGGVEIESHEASEFFRSPLSAESIEGVGDALADYYELPEKAFVLQDLLEHCLACLTDNDATLLEINPLVLTDAGEIIAADGKVTLDDAAAFRHPDWQFEDAPADVNFVTLDTDGTVATIANGAGLAMATVDAVAASGLTPANFLDIGGSATTENIVKAFEKIMKFPHVSAIVINIFGGIVRCDTVAEAVIEARGKLTNLPELYIRLSGTNSEEAAALLADHNITLYSTLEDCLSGVAQ